MKHRWFRAWWLLFLVPLAIGFVRLRFNVEVLDLLPEKIPSVTGLKIYQRKFSDSRELIITLRASDRATATEASKNLAEKLRAQTNLVESVIWQPPWLEHPEQTAELIAHIWINQPPKKFRELASRLAPTNLPNVLADARDELATSMSPTEIARLSYDPFGFTRLPENVFSAAQSFGQGDEAFASADGTFRILFVKAARELSGYRECADWVEQIKAIASSNQTDGGISFGFTGRPVFVAEISASMKRDITVSILGTAVLIAILFFIAHRRFKPMLWLLALLMIILASTIALGGLFFGTINVLSMGFAAVLLGLAVDYAVVHYQEALAHPDLSIPQIRRAIAPSIFWAATTTIAAFLVLNFGGLPGLAQLGSLVALGVTLAAIVMIFAFLPPLFPERMHAGRSVSNTGAGNGKIARENFITRIAQPITLILIAACGIVLMRGLPKIDASARALEPRDSSAYAALDDIKRHLNQNREPLWLVVAGTNETQVAQRLDATLPALQAAVSNQTLGNFTLPTHLWPRPEHQIENRPIAAQLIAQSDAFRGAARDAGFSDEALGLAREVLNTWQRAVVSTNVVWPTNPASTWIFEKLAVREATNLYAVGFAFPPTNGVNLDAIRELDAQLPRDGTWLAGWNLLGATMLDVVRANLWRVVAPMILLVLLSLWLAFRRVTEVLLSLGVLLCSGLILLTVMRFAGWSWNLLNLMALPLILGTGVDYGIFTQLALRRHGGNLAVAHRSVGRALLLCGGTAIAGFGMLGLSSNAGMASLGQVCAVGIAANMLLAVYLLPAWWKLFAKFDPPQPPRAPSSLYSAKFWSAGLFFARLFPPRLADAMAHAAGTLYWLFARHRREIVFQNLLPVFNGDSRAARRATRQNFQQFAIKLADLWRYESGAEIIVERSTWSGWEIFNQARQRGHGLLVVTPHLGNWEFGAAYFAQHDIPLLVLTQAEPDAALTQLRQQSRAKRGIETLVVGEDPFAFVEIIKRLQAGATVALLVDRPPAPTAVTVELFGKPFEASIAAAELARASGCAIVPCVIVREGGTYRSTILPEIVYDRAKINDRAARIRLTQEIMRAFEPAIREHPEQWYHFVRIWSR